MLKIEKKLIEWIEKHMFVLQLVLVSVLALYIRRIAIWWNTDDIGAYFDYHDNCTQSYLYYLVVNAVQYLPMLPVHSVKWMSILGDFGTAFLCLLLVKESNEENVLLQVFCYTICLFSPVLFLRGAVWAQMDSVAVCLFLLGWLFFDKRKKGAAEIFMLLSALLYPCMLVFVLCFLWKKRKENVGNFWITALGFLVAWLLFCGCAALSVERGFLTGLKNSVAWLLYDPVTGQSFATGLDWIREVLIAVGLPGSVIGGLVLVRHHRVSYFAVIVTHFLITILYGSRMF